MSLSKPFATLTATAFVAGLLTFSPVFTDAAEAKRMRGGLTGLGILSGSKAVRAANRGSETTEKDLDTGDSEAKPARAMFARPTGNEEDDIEMAPAPLGALDGKVVCIAGC